MDKFIVKRPKLNLNDSAETTTNSDNTTVAQKPQIIHSSSTSSSSNPIPASANAASDNNTHSKPATSESTSQSQQSCKPPCKQKQSTFVKHPWIERTGEGYLCQICRQYGLPSTVGTWITEPLPLKSSDKLYLKADKHASSDKHQMALHAANMSRSGTSIATQLTVAANTAAVKDSDVMKQLFRTAYYMFKSEMSHTTLWRDTVSNVAACDSSGKISSYLKNSPANAHHLSTKAITSILEAFGTTIESVLRNKLAGCKEFAIMADESSDINGVEELSLCVRYINSTGIIEQFLGCWPLQSTKAVDITEAIVSHLHSFGLDPADIVAASFDGASTMSGEHGGVQALLKAYAPNLLFVHCRSHLLQLALVKACDAVPNIKRVLSAVTKLYSLFSHSPRRLNMLKATQVAVDKTAHKLVQPGQTRWLSFHESVRVVLQHYAAICLTLESLYVDAGDLSSDAGGLLLTFRKSSTLLYLHMLHSILQPLAKLSQVLQSGTDNIASAMTIVKATICSLRDDFSFADLERRGDETATLAVDAGVTLEPDSETTRAQQLAICEKYKNKIVENMENRFSDKISHLAQLHLVLATKSDDSVEKLVQIASTLNVPKDDLLTEWRIVKRMPSALHLQDSMVEFATSIEKKAMFPVFSRALRHLLLLPIGTAGVERSFSTMHRILCCERSRLLSSHVCQLMQISIEGCQIPDVRDGTDAERQILDELISAAYDNWLKKPRRLVQEMGDINSDHV